MTETDKWEQLRAPFTADEIEKLPKYTGQKDASGKIPKSAYKSCEECGKYHPFPCIHLDYIGHATITERLNSVDPSWTWEPMAFTTNGTPLMSDGGLWAYMTVLGVRRPCFGDSQDKNGPNATKEVIGDLIRNGAMRFGVGTYLWSKSEKAEAMKHPDDDPDPEPGSKKDDAANIAALRERLNNGVARVAQKLGEPEDNILGLIVRNRGCSVAAMNEFELQTSIDELTAMYKEVSR